MIELYKLKLLPASLPDGRTATLWNNYLAYSEGDAPATQYYCDNGVWRLTLGEPIEGILEILNSTEAK